MLPYIHTPLGNISMFTFWTVVGIFSMILSIDISIASGYRQQERAFIFPRIVICGGIGYFTALLTDLIFKYIEYSVFKIYGLTFYGGLLGAVVAMFFILKYSNAKTRYTPTEWFNILTPPFILFHFFGRIGCFFGGCCYGRNSESVFAVAFPDQPEVGIFHNGNKCLPTQLFEACALLVIYLIVKKSDDKLSVYFVLYAIARFFIEFLRGDDRGYVLNLLSPSQLISILVILLVAILKASVYLKGRKTNLTS